MPYNSYLQRFAGAIAVSTSIPLSPTCSKLKLNPQTPAPRAGHSPCTPHASYARLSLCHTPPSPSSIVRHLHKRLGDRIFIVVLDNAVHDKFGPLLPAVTYIRGDVTVYSHVYNALAGCAGVVHSAAALALVNTPPALLERVNLGGTKNVVEACLERDVGALVYTSSGGCGCKAVHMIRWMWVYTSSGGFGYVRGCGWWWKVDYWRSQLKVVYTSPIGCWCGWGVSLRAGRGSGRGRVAEGLRSRRGVSGDAWDMAVARTCGRDLAELRAVWRPLKQGCGIPSGSHRAFSHPRVVARFAVALA